MLIYILLVDQFIAVLNIIFIYILFRLPSNLVNFTKITMFQIYLIDSLIDSYTRKYFSMTISFMFQSLIVFCYVI
jgi:hypothetical protein